MKPLAAAGFTEATSNLGRASVWPKTANPVMVRSIAPAAIPAPETLGGAGRDCPSNLPTRCAREPPVAAIEAL